MDTVREAEQPPPSPQFPQFLVVTFPTQSHLNPAIQLAYRLIRSGATVTFATTVSASKRIEKAATTTTTSAATTGQLTGLHFATFSDGFDDGYQTTNHDNDTGPGYFASMKQRGSETLSDLINRHEGRFDCVVYTMILTWVADVARQHGLQSAVLWVQPAAMLNICYFYFCGGYSDAIRSVLSGGENDDTTTSSDSNTVRLPGIPTLLEASDLPTFLSPVTNQFTFLFPLMKEQIEELETQSAVGKNQRVNILVNTFDALEVETLKSLPSKFNVRTVGPLLPIQEDSSTNNRFVKDLQLDLFQKSNEDDYMSWLDSNQDSSVVYVSFGSLSVLSANQMEELSDALMEIGRPFLWVIRQAAAASASNNEGDDDDDDQRIVTTKMMNWLKQQENKKGMVVPWCSQVEVLSHKAVGCFVTHCGWNSSLESLVCGVPVVGMPQCLDQMPNSKLLEDVWRVGVRARPPKGNEDDKESSGPVVGKEEIRRCVEEVMRNEEIRKNSSRLKELAVQAGKQSGSSDRILKDFIDEVVSRR